MARVFRLRRNQRKRDASRNEADLESLNELVERAQRGDTAAQDILFRDIRPSVCLSVKSRMGASLRARCDAEDICQDVLLRILRSLGSGAYVARDQGSFRHWVTAIVTRQVCDEANYQKAEKRASDRTISIDSLKEGTFSSRLGERDAALRHLETADEIGELLKAIDRLPPEEAEAVRLIDLEGLDYERAASILRMSSRTVRRRHENSLRLLALDMTLKGDLEASPRELVR